MCAISTGSYALTPDKLSVTPPCSGWAGLTSTFIPLRARDVTPSRTALRVFPRVDSVCTILAARRGHMKKVTVFVVTFIVSLIATSSIAEATQ